MQGTFSQSETITCLHQKHWDPSYSTQTVKEKYKPRAPVMISKHKHVYAPPGNCWVLVDMWDVTTIWCLSVIVYLMSSLKYFVVHSSCLKLMTGITKPLAMIPYIVCVGQSTSPPFRHIRQTQRVLYSVMGLTTPMTVGWCFTSMRGGKSCTGEANCILCGWTG